jgi:hypothetical protein
MPSVAISTIVTPFFPPSIPKIEFFPEWMRGGLAGRRGTLAPGELYQDVAALGMITHPFGGKPICPPGSGL